ncbi:MAG: hypothetical protein SFV18_19510 [Bryobacteraceae bacterium]|nr:hypothetical protein [Bryobacteraceae bacterium]
MTSFETVVEHESAAVPGVRFRVRRMTFGRRIELTKRVRELAQRIEFAEAGETFAGKVEASLATLEVERLYLDWGLESVSGLTADGEPVDRENAAERAPEALTREMIAAIKHECGLSEEERKN